MDKLIEFFTEKPILTFSLSSFLVGLLIISSHYPELMVLIQSITNTPAQKTKSRKKQPSMTKTMVVAVTLMGIGVLLALFSNMLDEGYKPYKVKATDWIGKWDIVMQEEGKAISWADAANGEITIKETADKLLKAEILKASNINLILKPLDSYANLKAQHRAFNSGETRHFEFFMSGIEKNSFVARYQDNTTRGNIWRIIVGRKKSFE
jgi:hypothetical protein